MQESHEGIRVFLKFYQIKLINIFLVIYIYTYLYIISIIYNIYLIYIYRDHSASTSLGKEGEVEKKATKRHRKESVQSKKRYHSHKFFYVLFSVTQSFLLCFSGSSDNITANNKKGISKKEPTS